GRVNSSAYIIYQIAKALEVEIHEIYNFAEVE
ncbi:MAG: hypothetical protein JWP37_3636, partial [Mucilaginibacter sp.]|nr:hypothetical protein [Mucilaginibacter sp.]